MVLRHIRRGLVKAAAVGIVAARKVKHAVIGKKGSRRRAKAKKLAKAAAKRVARKVAAKGRKVAKKVARKLRYV